jgi:hypothetical protein
MLNKSQKGEGQTTVGRSSSWLQHDQLWNIYGEIISGTVGWSSSWRCEECVLREMARIRFKIIQ